MASKEIMQEQLDQLVNQGKTYSVRSVCKNCGYTQTVAIPFGELKPEKVACNQCGCHSSVTGNLATEWDRIRDVR